jgi:hypothetical protein
MHVFVVPRSIPKHMRLCFFFSNLEKWTFWSLFSSYLGNKALKTIDGFLISDSPSTNSNQIRSDQISKRNIPTLKSGDGYYRYV